MKYVPPIINSKKQWVPVVVKNKDYLVGYLKGVKIVEDILSETLKSVGYNYKFDNTDVYLDSSRFNDILMDGRRESELTKEEKTEIFRKLVLEKNKKLKDYHEENETNYNDLLTIECTCGYGFYSWKNEYNIPEKTFECELCGRLLIDYTGYDDYKFEFDDGKE